MRRFRLVLTLGILLTARVAAAQESATAHEPITGPEPIVAPEPPVVQDPPVVQEPVAPQEPVTQKPEAAQVPAAQPSLVSPPLYSFNDLACAPFLTVSQPDARFRVTGSMETFIKRMMGTPDILVVNAGARQGLQNGQEFFVRRLTRHMGERGPDRDHPIAVHTAGWIKITSVGPATSTATITHACADGIFLDDYLEPFVPPLVAAREIDGASQLNHFGHVQMGDAGRMTFGVGEFTTIDWGSDHGVMTGQRFTIYRDTGGSAGLLVEIGTVIATAVRPDNATVRVLESRDAIRRYDFVAMRR